MQLRLVLFSLHQEVQIRKAPNYFFGCSLAVACRIGNFFFFFSSSLKSLSNSQNTSVHSFPTRCQWYHFATTHGLYGLFCFCNSARPGSHALPRPVVTRTTLLSRLHQALPKSAGKRKFICTSQLYIPRFSR